MSRNMLVPINGRDVWIFRSTPGLLADEIRRLRRLAGMPADECHRCGLPLIVTEDGDNKIIRCPGACSGAGEATGLLPHVPPPPPPPPDAADLPIGTASMATLEALCANPPKPGARLRAIMRTGPGDQADGTNGPDGTLTEPEGRSIGADEPLDGYDLGFVFIWPGFTGTMADFLHWPEERLVPLDHPVMKTIVPAAVAEMKRRGTRAVPGHQFPPTIIIDGDAPEAARTFRVRLLAVKRGAG